MKNYTLLGAKYFKKVFELQPEMIYKFKEFEGVFGSDLE